MSTSEPRRLELLDLNGDLPPSPASEFREQNTFERLSTAPQHVPSAEEIHRAGVAEGEQLGRAAAMKELEPVIAELRQLAVTLGSVREQRIAQAESELVDVASQLAARILHGELAQPGDAVVRMARACIQEAADEGPLVLRAAPSDLELLRAHVADLEVDLAEGGLALHGDPALAPGCVVLESKSRCYDGRPERILAAARARLEAENES